MGSLSHLGAVRYSVRMAFVDELNVHLKAGRGGDGVVRWLHLKGKEFSGAAGGNGGRGGSVYAEGVRDVTALAGYMHEKKYAAKNGRAGGGKSRVGANGDDLVMYFPVGSVITNTVTGERFELLEEGERHQLLKGGSGGYGNEHFKGSKNVTPMQSTKGKPGEEADFYVELRLVVDAGFIGLPNAGKSSLLNALTGAHAKVGAYAFTTLNPNLGVLYGYVLADIPGLIEGASEGKGLGHTFLRHIKRTKMVVHCISFEHKDAAAAYKTIRAELAAYDADLAEKPEMIVLTKKDLLEEAGEGDAVRAFCKVTGKKEEEIVIVSILDDASVKRLGERLTQYLQGMKRVS